MANREQDMQDIERYLAGDSELSRLYREAPNEQPSAQCNDAILSAAQTAAAQRARPTPSVGQRLWRRVVAARAAVATAASLVLVIGLALSVYREYGLDIPADLAVEAPARSAGNLRPEPNDKENRYNSAQQAPDTQTPAIAGKSPAAPTASEPSTPPGSDRLRSREAERLAKRSAAPEATAPAGVSMAEQAAVPAPQKPAPADDSKAVSASRAAPYEISAPPYHDARQTDSELPPDVWLKKIEKLIEADNLDAAKLELKAFKQAYPAHQLSARVKQLDLQ